MAVREYANKTLALVEGELSDRLTELTFKNSNPHSSIAPITITLVTLRYVLLTVQLVNSFVNTINLVHRFS